MTTPSPSMPQALHERRVWYSLPFGLTWTLLTLISIVILAAVLRFANLGAIGESNTYYTAAVESMLQSWHNFFFVAAEPGGSVSVDKPPVGLWLEAISASVLGVNGFAVVLPQILSGICSVILLFHLVRRWFGTGAGLLAAFILAVTPVAIAVERNNTQDATLILSLLLATWAFIKATETHKLHFLMIGAALIGVGFNIKMMQAFLPLPALYALYFFGSQQGWWRKMTQLGLATLVLIPVSLSWAIIVDLTPADQRPYVGSSENNSALNLIVGYNGVQRLVGNDPGAGAGLQKGQPFAPPAMPNADKQAQGMPPAGAGPAGLADGPVGFAGGLLGVGNPGVLRLFQSDLAAEASWLLPFGLMLIVAMACSVSWRRPQTNLHRGLILWGGWLLTCAIFFSIARFFHHYYLVMLGAPLAAIVAMGLTWLWHLRSTYPIRAALLLLVTAGATLAFQVYAVILYQSLSWWIAVPVGLGLLGAGMLLLSLWRNVRVLPDVRFALVTAALLVVPTVWSGLTTAYADVRGPMPRAYAGSLGIPGMPDGGAPGGPGNPMQLPPGVVGGLGGDVNQHLLNYLQANTQDTKYLLVVPRANVGSAYVLATGRPVLYAGGFSGGDPVIDGDDLATLVANGEVRYVLWGGGGPSAGNASITSHVQSACTIVTDASLGTATSKPTAGSEPYGGWQSTLYQCRA